MKKLILALAASALFVTTTASANWSVGAGYTTFSSDDNFAEVTFGTLVVSTGYTFESKNSSLSFMPELAAGTGVKDDSINMFGTNVDVGVDTFFAASVRGNYHLSEQFTVFLQPTYGRLKVTASARGVSASTSEWNFSFGGGAAVNFNDNISAEVIYQKDGGSDIFSLGLRYAF